LTLLRILAHSVPVGHTFVHAIDFP
jgi:hypothetical protein